MRRGAFNGPLFLVGMPRSGTKLLRNMLGAHPRIRFWHIETQFFPYWVERWSTFGPLHTRECFRRFYTQWQQHRFFDESRRRGLRIDCDEWFDACRDFSAAGVFEGLMRYVLGIASADEQTIWGDKSPAYLAHIPLLMKEFEQARVIHIVRDARDHCLSMRKAWGKSMLRAAQRWQDDVSKAMDDGRGYGSAYLEIRYEDLLEAPGAVLEQACRMLEVDFDEHMLSLDPSTEPGGAARGMSTVLRSNAGKYRSQMSPAEIDAIERITCASLRRLGYPCAYRGPLLRLPAWKERTLQLHDSFRIAADRVYRYGLARGAKFQFTHWMTSSHRSQ